MNFGKILADEMKQTVETIRFGCGVSRVFDGAGAWLRLAGPVHYALCSGVCPSRVAGASFGNSAEREGWK